MTIGSMWLADMATSTVSAVLTAWIFTLYLRRAADVRSKFSYGLALLAGIFFAESALSIGVYLHFSTRYSLDVALPMFSLSALGLAGFAVLAWIAKQ